MRKPDDINTANDIANASDAAADAVLATALRMTVNGQPLAMPANSTLADLLTQLGHAPESIATALNGEFIPRVQRDQQTLRSGDKVTCFQAITGG
jgi:sulfur carrier protein